MKIAHVSDIHIRLKERHNEYEEVFKNLYKSLEEESPDLIIVAGDIVHSKITLSPESVSIARDFLVNLARIAPLNIIAGNHDMNMRNMNRMDALTPIIDAAQGIPTWEIKYLTQTGFYDYKDFVFGVQSLNDGKPIYLKDKDENKIYISLFHGPIAGCKLDNGYALEGVKTSLRTFQKFDFGMFGDIHKMQYLDKEERFAYCGSLIQQDFGEVMEKGYLLWDIESRDEFSSKFVRIENDYGYKTVEVEDIDSDVDVGEVPKDCRLRIRIHDDPKNVSRAKISKITHEIKSKCNPISVSVVYKHTKADTTLEMQQVDGYDINSFESQQKIIKSWYDQNKIPDGILVKDILELDDKIYDQVHVTKEEDFGNTMWWLNKITINNFMSYDGPVEIDFQNMNGVIGLFGDNAVGKSVIIDALLYAFFNKVTRNVTNDQLVNKFTGRDVCSVVVDLEIHGVNYRVERSSKRNVSKAGKVSSSTSLDIKRKFPADDEWENISEDQRRVSENVIRTAIGTYEDFLTTTLSTQLQSNGFVTQKPAQRTDSIIRFLGLDMFTRKHDVAKEMLRGCEYKIKNFSMEEELGTVDLSNETITTKSDLIKVLENQRKKNNKSIKTMMDSSNSLSRKIVNINLAKDETPESLKINIENVNSEIEELEGRNKTLTKTIKDLSTGISEIEKTHIFTDDKLETTLLDKRDLDTFKENLRVLRAEMSTDKRMLESYKKDLSSETPCPVSYDENHSGCHFLSGLKEKKKECKELMEEFANLIEKEKAWNAECERLSYSVDALAEQEKIREKLSLAFIKLDQLKNELSDVKSKLEVKRMSLSLVEGKLKVAIENVDAIKKNIIFENNISELKQSIDMLNKNNDELFEKITEAKSSVSIAENNLEKANKKIKDMGDVEVERKLCAEYCSIMHRNGIPLFVMKNYIHIINREINTILSDVVGFMVFLEIDEEKMNVNVFMRYDGEIDDTRPATMASGYERLLMDFAIRYALISVTTLNRPNTWFIDEGFGVLDNDNLYMMEKFFDNVKSMFKNIIIITHVDELKDIANHVVTITKRNGISQVSIQ